MKRNILVLLGVALLAAAGCAKFEHEDPESPVTVSSPSITLKAVDDYTVNMTIAPVSGTGYYSYAVFKGDVAATASKVFKVSYKNALYSGTVSYKQAPTLSVTLKNLDANTTYKVYAVAASEQGTVGSLVSETIKTSDKKAPVLEDYDCDGNTIYLYYDEDVKVADNADISAVVYAKLYVTGTPVIASTKGVATAKGSTVSVVFDEVTVPGSYYTVAFPEGTFVDLVGNKAAAVEAGTFSSSSKGISYSGDVYGYTENDAIEVSYETPTAITDYNKYFISLKSATMINNVYAKMITVNTKHTASNGDVSNTSHVLSGAPYYGATSYYTVGIKLDSEPAKGDYLSFTIPAKTWRDIYGNYNDEITINDIPYSYGFTLADITGNYTFAGTSVFGATYNEDPTPFVIAASDDEDAGNVMITSIFGFDDAAIYCTFDPILGKFTVPCDGESDECCIGYEQEKDDDGVYWYYEYYTQAYYGTECTYDMTAAHTFTDVDDYFGYIYYIYYYDTTAGSWTYYGYDYNMFKCVPVYDGATPSSVKFVPVSKNLTKDFAPKHIPARRAK